MADTLIVGAGLAGALAGWTLSFDQEVTLVEAKQPGAGASGVAAGLAHTFMARRANPMEHRHAAWSALRRILSEAGADEALLDYPVVRPARETKQAEAFQATAADYPVDSQWWSEAEASACVPWLQAPHGALCVRQGCAIDVVGFVERVVADARERGAEVRLGTELIGWEERSGGVDVTVRRNGVEERLMASRLILALGYGWHQWLTRIPLSLHFIKGHTVRVARPSEVTPGHHVSGTGYAVIASETITLGSTYEHTFTDLEPDPAQVKEVLSKTSSMIPALADAEIVDVQAGVRVTVPGIRKPVVGPVTAGERVWALTGLGSKGLLMGAWLASQLPEWLADPTSIPDLLRPRFSH